MIKRISVFIRRRKMLSLIIAVVLIVSGYYGYKKIKGNETETRYVLAAVQKGTLIVSVSGSGQVSVSNDLEIKSKVSEDVVYVGVANGQEVKTGSLLVQLDARDAQKAVRDAEVNLESAQLTLEKLKGAETAAVPRNKENAQNDLTKSYEDGFNTVASAFSDLPNIMTGLQDLLFGNSFNANQSNLDYYADAVKNYDESVKQYRNSAYDSYQTARKAYDQNFADYKSATRFSDTATIERLISQTYDTAKLIADAIKNSNSLIQFYKDRLTERNLKPNPLADTHLATISTYTSQISSHLLSLLNIKQTIQDGKDAVINADLDIKSQELVVKQRENSLLDAKEKLADYYVRAPFDGLVAKIDAKKGDQVSAGTIVATMITKQRLAEISMNEVDVAKVKVGQKAVLTFDAVPDLSITGQVAEIDTIGTQSQGVVSYTVKISFDPVRGRARATGAATSNGVDTQDERVKPGMTVSANIITDVKPDVLMAPNSAVKTQAGRQFVEVTPEQSSARGSGGTVLAQPPQRRQVQTGLANDEFTEIVSGLNEGEVVVANTIGSQAATNANQQQSNFRVPGLPGSGGGGFRAR